MTLQSEAARLVRIPAVDLGTRWSTLVRSAALVLLAAALFTASWDRLGNVVLGAYNVKLPSLLFSLAALLALPALPALRIRWRESLALRLATLVVLGIVLMLVVATAASQQPRLGVAQLASVMSGAVLPAFSLVVLLNDRRALLWAMRWFVTGAVAASVFGLYQLLAFYLRWPQFVEYSGTGVASAVGRIAAFNYEPAYFANFLLLALGVAATSAVLEARVLGWLPVAWFTVVLVLANVRALLFIVPVLAVLLALRWRTNRKLLLRLAVAGAIVTVVNVAATAGVTAVIDASSSTRAAQSPPPARAVEPAAPPRAASGPALQNPLDPGEQSSNAPRLALYGAVLSAVLAHPVLGVGPGALALTMQSEGYVAPNQGGVVVANNVWLQALADGGFPLLLLEVAVVAGVAWFLLRRAYAPLQPMLSVWLAVLLVSGMLTSYFFDVKIWIVLALTIVGVGVLNDTRSIKTARTEATRTTLARVESQAGTPTSVRPHRSTRRRLARRQGDSGR